MTIVITRHKTYGTGSGYSCAWCYTYTYRIDGGPLARHGRGLPKLLSYLRRAHPDATVRKTWEEAK